MSFNTLPTELLGHILSFLYPCVPGFDYDLSRVSCTSKRLRNVTLPLLYREVLWIRPKLLLLLADNAYLASLVRSIDISEASHISNPALVRQAAQIAGRRGALTPAYQKLLNTASDRALRAAVGMFLVALLPKVTSLTYDRSVVDNVVIPLYRATRKTLFGRIDAPGDIRQELREIRAMSMFKDAPSSIFVRSAFLHQDVEKFYGSRIALSLWDEKLGQRNRRLLARLPDKLSLRLVELDNAGFSVEGMRAFLKRCPNLQTLRIALGPRSASDPYDYLDFGGLGQALREYGLGLEELSLDIRSLNQPLLYNEGKYRTFGRIGSLRELMRLKKLKVPYGVLLGGGFDSDDNEQSSDSEILGHLDIDNTLDGEEDEQPIPYSVSNTNNTSEAQPPLTLDQCLPDFLERLRLFSTVRVKDVGDLNRQICDLFRAPARQGTLYRVQLQQEEEFVGDTEAFGFRKSHTFDELFLMRDA